jgi:hypothetical protein
MVNFSSEGYFWRFKGIICGHLDVQEKYPSFIGRSVWAYDQACKVELVLAFDISVMGV